MKACVEWLLFVDANRDRKTVEPIHDYDIIGTERALRFLHKTNVETI